MALTIPGSMDSSHNLALCVVIALLNSPYISSCTFNLHFVTCSAIVN